MKHLALALALALTVLTGCEASSGGSAHPAKSRVARADYDHNAELSESKTRLSDGRIVTCLSSVDGISCDWWHTNE